MAVALLALIQCLPRLLDIGIRLGNWMIANNMKQWIDNLEASIDKLEKAQTPADKLGAARDLVGSIHNLS